MELLFWEICFDALKHPSHVIDNNAGGNFKEIVENSNPYVISLTFDEIV